MTIREEKAALRRSIRERLASCSAPRDLCAQQKQAILQLLHSELYLHSTTVLAYVATRDEFSLHELIVRALADGKDVALPKCNPHDRSMEFHRLDNSSPYQSQLRAGAYGILEPPGSLPRLEVQQLPESALVLVPALALTRRGQRLGKGKGFYDRYLHKMLEGRGGRSFQRDGAGRTAGPILIGVAHSCQIVETLPAGEHDVTMDYILTAQGLAATAHA